MYSRYYLEVGNFIIWLLFCTLFQKISCTLDEWTLMVTCSTFIFAVASFWSELWVLNKRSFLDVEWELHLSIGLKTNISNTVGDHIGGNRRFSSRFYNISDNFIYFVLLRIKHGASQMASNNYFWCIIPGTHILMFNFIICAKYSNSFYCLKQHCFNFALISERNILKSLINFPISIKI